MEINLYFNWIARICNLLGLVFFLFKYNTLMFWEMNIPVDDSTEIVSFNCLIIYNLLNFIWQQLKIEKLAILSFSSSFETDIEEMKRLLENSQNVELESFNSIESCTQVFKKIPANTKTCICYCETRGFEEQINFEHGKKTFGEFVKILCFCFLKKNVQKLILLVDNFSGKN